MIIRKPYAFLIKNFKKIHIFLLVLCAYVYYKNMQVYSFTKEFIELGTYDVYNEPITRYVTNLSLFFLILIIIGSLALAFLLRHKKKPWKLYLLPALEYTVMFFTFMAIKSFFNSYTGNLESATIRAMRDVIFITSIFEYPVFALLLMRIFGVDLRKFNFQLDKEYLELSSEDREELEINIDIDKETFKRGFKRLLRNLNYVYQEHKLVCNTIAIILLVIVMKNTYTYIFVTHKTYKQGDSLTANGYTITINNSYYTDKDYTGNIISKDSNFVILDLTVKNNLAPREIDLNKFHVMNGINNYITTQKTYETEFQDFGKTYQTKELKRDETFSFIIVFKVDKKLKSNRFVLYYQELDKEKPYLRKIKLHLKDVSKIKDAKSLEPGTDFTFKIQNHKETISLDNYDLVDNIEYTYRNCNSSTCGLHTATYTAIPGQKIMEINFSSSTYEGKDLIDFSTKYGKIKYIDSENKEKIIDIKNSLNRVYSGKYLYIKVPRELEQSNKIELVYTVRNNRYIYKLK